MEHARVLINNLRIFRLKQIKTETRLFVRTFIHTRNLSVTRALHTNKVKIVQFSLPKFQGPFRMRTGTSDAMFFRALANGWEFPEYEVPIQINPRTVLDLGANIGVESIILARTYPGARILAVEALPENIKFLEFNVQQFENVEVVPYGIGSHTEVRNFVLSDDPWNWGGGGINFSDPGVDMDALTVPVLGVSDMLERYNVRNVDLIKIDIEGGEHEVLTNFPPQILRETKCIVGELHGDKSALLDYLSQWFVVQRKPSKGRPKYFTAISKILENQLS